MISLYHPDFWNFFNDLWAVFLERLNVDAHQYQIGMHGMVWYGMVSF